jgi:hypothetical protein
MTAVDNITSIGNVTDGIVNKGYEPMKDEETNIEKAH